MKAMQSNFDTIFKTKNDEFQVKIKSFEENKISFQKKLLIGLHFSDI